MNLNALIPYHEILINNGWHKEDDRIYSPYGSFNIAGSECIQFFMIQDMHNRIKQELQKLLNRQDTENFERYIEDMKSYVEITAEIIKDNSTKEN